MEQIQINSRIYTMFGKIRGHQKDKWNRATKLAYRFEELDEKFRGICRRGIQSNTEHSRCALALLLMMHTGIRVGNEGSAEGYMTKPHPYSNKKPEFVQTYGLTTLKWEHITLKGKRMDIEFLGKKQVENGFYLTDATIVHYMKVLKSVSGSAAVVFGVTDYMLTKFIKKYVGKGFTPKDFRCMRANMYAWDIAGDIEWDEKETKKEMRESIKVVYEYVSQQLCNTPGVCKKSYVCPKLEMSLWNNFNT